MTTFSSSRRRFLQHLAAGATLAAPGVSFLPQLAAVPLPAMPQRPPAKSLIILWMDGGIPHLDLWSIHQGSPNQGAFNAIETAAPGIKISELMPAVAKQFKHLSVIRTMRTDEEEGTRATIQMLTGLRPNRAGVKVPHLGAIVAAFAGNPRSPLRFVSIGATAERIGQGSLPAVLAPLVVPRAGTVPENLPMAQLGDEAGQELRRETGRLFEFDADDRQRLSTGYGDDAFGRGCLLARKLVEFGVGAVQVDLTGWPATGIDNAVRGMAAHLDRAMGTLVKELAERGKLADTLVVCLAPYGRMVRWLERGQPTGPWTNGWDVVLGGAGIKPGVEYGKMAVGGTAIKEKPVNVQQLHATIHAALGIDLANPRYQLCDNLGRRFHPFGENATAEPIAELLAG